jgi:tetratricopeptide (TPR) repeat protein
VNASRYLWLAIAILVLLLAGSRRNKAALRKAKRRLKDVQAAMSVYRAGDYAAGLQATERLKDGTTATGEYCMFRGYMLHQLGRLSEAEASFRQALPLRSDPRRRALSLNSLATVLMDQERFTEAIAFYENASQVWPDRGASLRGIAEVWLRQGREPAEALGCARQAVAIDRNAIGMSKEVLSHRLGEDLAVLAWALAVHSKSSIEVEGALAEAFQLCGNNNNVSMSAEIHYHAGRAYFSLAKIDKSKEHFRQAAQIDPNGRFGRLVASTFS